MESEEAPSDRRRPRYLCQCAGRLYTVHLDRPQPGDWVVVPGRPARVQRYHGQRYIGVLRAYLPEWSGRQWAIAGQGG